MPTTTDQLPSGLDRGDGIDGRIGTPVVDGDVATQSATGEIVTEEESDSPEIERAEQATLTHRFTMSWANALTAIQYYGRGSIVTDSYGNVTKVLSAKIQHHGAASASLHITSEGLSFDSPPDEFSIQPVELGVNIMKHPRYFKALDGSLPGSAATDRLLNQDVIRVLQNYFEKPTAAYRDNITKQMFISIGHPGSIGADGRSLVRDEVTYSDPDLGKSMLATAIAGTDMAKRAAIEIIQKYWRNEETPYMVGWQITWSSYFFSPQYLNPGGYIEDPIVEATPQLPDYFWAVEPIGTSGGFTTIFNKLAALNPQCYSSDGTKSGGSDISWLRKADTQAYQRTWFKVDRIWCGSAVGNWDIDFYTKANRPSSPDHYSAASPSPTPPDQAADAP